MQVHLESLDCNFIRLANLAALGTQKDSKSLSLISDYISTVMSFALMTLESI